MAFGGKNKNRDRDRGHRDDRDARNHNARNARQSADNAEVPPVECASDAVQDAQVRVPVVEEEIAVGKRSVETGGVRVERDVIEQPVNETLHLQEERVIVERYPVDRPAAEEDFRAFENQTVEIREIGEEPVIEKRARVIEEVVVGKETTQRTAHIADTVRRTDVRIVPLNAAEYRTYGGDRGDARGDSRGGGRDTEDRYFREHYRQRFAHTGWGYENGYAQAYRYGQELARHSRDWGSIKDEVRRQWNQRNPRAPWNQFKDAVRYGFDQGRRY